MTVRIEREGVVAASPDRVWEFIADPATRAKHISVVEDWTVADDGSAVWEIAVPIPLVDRTVTVETRDVERREPEYVEFVGTSPVANIGGEHRLEPVEGGTRVANEFVVEGRAPGVERFFEKNLDRELRNLLTALRETLEASDDPSDAGGAVERADDGDEGERFDGDGDPGRPGDRDLERPGDDHE